MNFLLTVKFNNEFSIADILSLLALLAMFITIVQVKKQAKRSIKPTVVFKENQQYYEYNDSVEDSSIDVELELSNIGAGVAKTVTVLSNLNLSKFKGLMQNIKITNDILQMKDNEHNVIYMIGNKEETFLYVEPNRKIYCSSIIGHYIKILCLIYTNIVKSNKHEKLERLLKKSNQGEIYYNIDYTDIHDKRYNNYFQLIIDPIIISRDGLSFKIKLKEIKSKDYKSQTKGNRKRKK